MATASRVDMVRGEDIRDVRLVLTHEEAATLRRICAKIGGPPNGRRGHMDSVKEALDSVGVCAAHESIATGSITFSS